MEIKMKKQKPESVNFQNMARNKTYRGAKGLLEDNIYLCVGDGYVVNLETGRLCKEDSFDDDERFVEVRCTLEVHGDAS